MIDKKRIKIITGHFGSGKTEIAINLALKEKEKYQKVAISDLDVINPYFRSRDTTDILEEKGIEVIAPKGKLATSDLPIVTREIYRVIYKEEYRLIIDVGGDKDGALALGQYYNDIKEMDYQMDYVINANRPLVNTVEGVINSIRQIESVSRLKVSGLINNTNLGVETTLETIVKGYELTKKVSTKLNIPILYTTISEQFTQKTRDFSVDNSVLYIYRYNRLPWE